MFRPLSVLFTFTLLLLVACGTEGPEGPQGPVGPRGPTGDAGVDGEDGEDGEDDEDEDEGEAPEVVGGVVIYGGSFFAGEAAREKAVEAAFKGVDMNALEEAWKEFVLDL